MRTISDSHSKRTTRGVTSRRADACSLVRGRAARAGMRGTAVSRRDAGSAENCTSRTPFARTEKSMIMFLLFPALPAALRETRCLSVPGASP